MMVMPVMITTRSSLSIPAVRVVTNEEARSRLLATAIAQLFDPAHHPPSDDQIIIFMAMVMLLIMVM